MVLVAPNPQPNRSTQAIDVRTAKPSRKRQTFDYGDPVRHARLRPTPPAAPQLLSELKNRCQRGFQ
jgi:hypothetical protein